MKTIKIIEDFIGYPNDKKRTFVKGEETEISNDYADLVIGKGHAKDITPAPAAEIRSSAPGSSKKREHGHGEPVEDQGRQPKD